MRRLNLRFWCVASIVLVALHGAKLDAGVYKEVAGQVVVEAEHFDKRTADPDDGKQWAIVPDDDPGQNEFQNARGKYIQSLPEANQNQTADPREQLPTAEYKVQISKAGNYRLWLRWSGYDGGSDSIYAWMKEVTTPGWYRYANGGNPDDADFASKVQGEGEGWDGIGAPESTSAGGGEQPAIFAIPAAGTYTIVIGQREDGSAVDALIFQLESLPPPTNPGPPESALVDAAPQPLSVSVSPLPDSPRAAFDKGISVTFLDGTTKLAQNSVVLELDGAKVTPTVKQEGGVTTVSFVPAQFFAPKSVHTAKVTYKDDKDASFTKEWSFTVQDYALIPASWAVQPDTSKPGFIVRVHQVGEGQPNTLDRTERQLAGELKGSDGNPLPNLADPNAIGSAKGPASPANPPTAPITFEVETVINMDQGAGSNGAFTPDDQMPGIPGVEGSTDNIAMEILTFIELPAGIIRMGVNSDDGFRTSSSLGDPRDKLGVSLGQFDGGRGAADTIFSFVVEAAGVYPFRTIWQEGGGGANIEWFIVKPDRAKALINGEGGPKAYRARAGAAPTVIARKAIPGAGQTGVHPDTAIEIELVDDGAAQVDTASVALKLNGSALTPSVNKNQGVTSIKAAPSSLLAPNSENAVELSFKAGAQTVTRSYTFRVANYGTLPLASATKLGSGKDRGFRIRTVQSEAARGNSDAEAERQLRDNRGAPNVADLSAAGPDGFFNHAGVINFNQDAPGAVGNFNANNNFEDQLIPGIPGTGGSTDNLSQEILTFLEFPTAGLVRMGVNSDDGFKVTPASGFDATAPVLGIFNGGRGAADTLFVFVVPEPGVYPMRLIWHEGGGGANVEWFTWTKDGAKILINSETPGAIKAFRTRDESQKLPVAAKPEIKISRDAANIVITYSGNLQSADEITGPWSDVSGAKSPHTVTVAGTRKFFRVRQ